MDSDQPDSSTTQQPVIDSEDRIPRDVERDDDNDEEAEDEGLDWTKVLPTAARPAIPKRGEKEFEPRAQGVASQDGPSVSTTTSTGTALQQHILNRAREAMFNALRAPRTISSKTISHGVWYPNLSRTHVVVARGVHFSNMGHSAPRASYDDVSVAGKIQKRLELLPEEAIYLIERGSMLCWKALPIGDNTPEITAAIYEGPIPGVPMSVQQVYTEMIGRDGLTAEKLQVYTYLKRLGYVVMRTEPLDPFYPTPPVLSDTQQLAPSVSQRIFARIRRLVSCFVRLLTRNSIFDWWHPIKLGGWLSHNNNHKYIFESLRFIPAGHKTPLFQSKARTTHATDSPYRIFYNVYKPNTPFKKSAPGKPDFQVVVVDARTTRLPSLHELTSVFGQLPDAIPQAPRRRGPNSTQEKKNDTSLPSSTPPAISWSSWFLHFIQKRLFLFSPMKFGAATLPRQNPFASLKMGKRIIVIAAVDSGSISFFRFGQGGFEEWPML
ncbi:hypothetical protein AX14_001939 [Amanita brunnescens Koide BX004]|nr:hypothetical protein AX14_001939 [Amanita brunnescens Koide BX004]